MTQKEKVLLLKVLSAMLPYGVLCDYVYHIGHPQKLLSISLNEKYQIHLDSDEYVFGSGKSYGPSETTVDDIKPYLRPMSSMTEEEKMEVEKLGVCHDGAFHNDIYDIGISMEEAFTAISWFLERHFDINYLIEKGLALEAPEDMYK